MRTLTASTPWSGGGRRTDVARTKFCERCGRESVRCFRGNKAYVCADCKTSDRYWMEVTGHAEILRQGRRKSAPAPEATSA